MGTNTYYWWYQWRNIGTSKGSYRLYYGRYHGTESSIVIMATKLWYLKMGRMGRKVAWDPSLWLVADRRCRDPDGSMDSSDGEHQERGWRSSFSSHGGKVCDFPFCLIYSDWSKLPLIIVLFLLFLFGAFCPTNAIRKNMSVNCFVCPNTSAWVSYLNNWRPLFKGVINFVAFNGH